MAAIRICHTSGCRTRLSTYNGGSFCSLHRSEEVPRRIVLELSGKVVLRDDEWVKRLSKRKEPPSAYETWRPHMMSKEFIVGVPDRLSPKEKRSYESGEWLSP
jgi:hypothetical protein